MADTNTHIVKSAQRVLEVLEYFDEDRPSATVTDIARELSYPQSSTSVLLQCLRELGYLYYDRFSRTYRLTARAALLGCWAEQGNYRGGRTIDLLDTVAEQVGETAMLSAGGVDYSVHHLHVIRGTGPDAADIRAGDCEPLLHSAQGELVLASYPDAQIRLALHRLNAEEEDPERRVNITEKLAEMQAIRERGWTIRHAPGADSGTVAVLIPRHRGGDRIVLSVVADRRVIEEKGEEFLQLMLEARARSFGARLDDRRNRPNPACPEHVEGLLFSPTPLQKTTALRHVQGGRN